MVVPTPGTGDVFTQAIIDGEFNRLSLPRQSQVVAGAAAISIDATYGFLVCCGRWTVDALLLGVLA